MVKFYDFLKYEISVLVIMIVYTI